MNMKVLTILGLLFLLSLPVAAQTNAAIEKDLVASLKAMQKFSTYGKSYNEAKLTQANNVFETKLVKYTKIATTLDHKFVELAKLMTIATSDDGKFRVYSWDLENGGTMHEYSRVYQFKAADGKVYSKTEAQVGDQGGEGTFVTDVFSMNTKSGAVYIACATGIAGGQNHYQGAGAYKIDGAEIKNRLKIFKNEDGLTDSLSFEYNFFSVVDRKERPIRLIKFDKATNTLKLPLVVVAEEYPFGRVTEKMIDYKFDGEYFVRVIE